MLTKKEILHKYFEGYPVNAIVSQIIQEEKQKPRNLPKLTKEEIQEYVETTICNMNW